MGDRKKILYLGNRRLYHGWGRGFKYDMFLELLKEELARQHDVLCWGWGYRYNVTRRSRIMDAIDFFGVPDIILADSLYGVGSIGNLNVVKGNVVGDFYPKMAERHFHRHIACFKNYDVLFFVCNSGLLLAKEHLPDKKCVFWPWSVDTNFFRNYDRDRPVDVLFAAALTKSLYGPERRFIQHMVAEMGREGLSVFPKLKRYFGAYVDALNKTKIAISNNSRHGFMPKKVLEIMACGALLLTDKCEEFDMVGIEDGKHVVIYDSIDDLREKIHYYLKNDSEREEIAFDGYTLAVREFSMADAARTMVETLSDVS